MNYKTFSLSWFSFGLLYLVFSLDGIHVCNLLRMGFLMNYFVDVQPGYSARSNSLERHVWKCRDTSWRKLLKQTGESCTGLNYFSWESLLPAASCLLRQLSEGSSYRSRLLFTLHVIAYSIENLHPLIFALYVLAFQLIRSQAELRLRRWLFFASVKLSTPVSVFFNLPLRTCCSMVKKRSWRSGQIFKHLTEAWFPFYFKGSGLETYWNVSKYM
jgi:hypothetical protein